MHCKLWNESAEVASSWHEVLCRDLSLKAVEPWGSCLSPSTYYITRLPLERCSSLSPDGWADASPSAVKIPYTLRWNTHVHFIVWEAVCGHVRGQCANSVCSWKSTYRPSTAQARWDVWEAWHFWSVCACTVKIDPLLSLRPLDVWRAIPGFFSFLWSTSRSSGKFNIKSSSDTVWHRLLIRATELS